MAATSIQRALDGTDEEISYDGTSQYASGGVSACGLAALNFARSLFTEESKGRKGRELLSVVVGRDNMEDIISICELWSDSVHLEVDDIAKAPIFKSSLKLFACQYGTPGHEAFRDILRELRKASAKSGRSAAAIITRPPEILTVARVCIANQPVFVIFDSHPRSEHPNGASVFMTISIDRAARYVNDLLHVDKALLAESGLQWQAQLLSNFSAHIFAANESLVVNDIPALNDDLLEASLMILKLRGELTQERLKNHSLAAENLRLQADLAQSRFQNRTLVSRKQPNPSQRPKYPSGPRSPKPGGSKQEWPSPARRPENVSQSIAFPRDGSGHDTVPHIPKKGHQANTGTSAQLAWDLQDKFNREHEQLEAQFRFLSTTAQVLFECSICLDKYPQDFATSISGCSHTTCRTCLRQYLLGMIGEHRYPIFCPACIDNLHRAEITNDVIFTIGIPQREFEIFEELQLSTLSILMHCHKCKSTIFVDRTEYQESRIIACPLPQCDHVWCKHCQQTVDVSGPQHSCDGSNELQHLMTEQGWKHCPGCQTPTSKDRGCNHMSCMSPGCNTHFCYICGGLIVQSALRGEIQSAVSAHYRQCTLFEVPE